MLGLMQDQPLLISGLIEFVARHNGDAEIVSRRVEGDIHRYTWSDAAKRARKVANALDAEKLQFSDRVATLAWNGYRHLELYYGVSGSGAARTSTRTPSDLRRDPAPGSGEAPVEVHLGGE